MGRVESRPPYAFPYTPQLFVYFCLMGDVHFTHVPRCNPFEIVNVPPMTLARYCMFWSPMPGDVVFCRKPLPLSRMDTFSGGCGISMRFWSCALPNAGSRFRPLPPRYGRMASPGKPGALAAAPGGHRSYPCANFDGVNRNSSVIASQRG